MSNSSPPRYVEEMKIPLVASLDVPEGVEVLNLGTNESPYGPPPAAIKSIQVKAQDPHRYCDPNATALRQAIGEYHGINPAQIVCGNGSEELLDVVGRVYARPGDEILHSEYGYRQFEMVAHRLGATQVKAPANDISTNVDGLLDKVTNKTKICFLANPENPTGTYIGEEDLRHLATELPSSVVLVIDSAYAEYVIDPDYSNGMALVDERDNAVVIRTFSKAWGLAGLRVGWAYCPPDLVGPMNSVRGLGNVNAIAQAAAVAALSDKDFTVKIRARTIADREKLAKDLKELGLEVVPSATNFVLIRFPDWPEKNAEAASKHLLAEGIILRHVPDHGLPEYIRMTLGTPKECKRVIDSLRHFLE